MASCAVVESYDGTAEVEATAVVMERHGEPSHAILVVRTPSGARTMAVARDQDIAASMVREAWEGRPVTLRRNDDVNELVA